jgi:hypothetical protein
MDPATIAGAAVIWLLVYCVDRCDGPSIYGEPNPRIERCHKSYDNACETSKTACIASRTELMDQGDKANRWVWAHCAEQPKSGHFHYLDEGKKQ